MDISPTLAMNSLMKLRVKNGLKTFRFGFGQSPFPIPNHLVEALKVHAHAKDYVPTAGLPQLRDAIAAYHSEKYSWEITPDQIIVGPGSKELIFLTQLVSGRDLVLAAPSWVSYAPQASLLNRNTSWIKTTYEEKWKLNPYTLEACLKKSEKPKVLILNYPGNPTGITYNSNELKTLAAISKKYNLLVISDEIYSEFTFERSHQSLYQYYPEGTVICSGLSKWCGAGGWRLGYMLFSKHLCNLRDLVIKAGSETYSCAPTPVQYAAIEAFRNPDEQVTYTKKCNFILKYISEHVFEKLDKSKIRTHRSEGGFYCLLNFDPTHYNFHSSDQLCQKLLDDTGVALLPGTAFGLPPEDLSARLAYVDIDGEKLLNQVINLNSDQQNLYLDIPQITKGIYCINNW